MKLISMHVDNFGGLHNYDYTFGEGLNVVLHDNGWGKTTMATFLKAMLYCIHSQSNLFACHSLINLGCADSTAILLNTLPAHTQAHRKQRVSA